MYLSRIFTTEYVSIGWMVLWIDLIRSSPVDGHSGYFPLGAVPAKVGTFKFDCSGHLHTRLCVNASQGKV